MALSVGTIWEARAATGNDNSGGGFVAGATGTDFSQQAAAQFSGTDLAVDATTNTKVTSATHNFAAADVGNLIQVTAGTGWTTGFYQIVSVAANAATLDRSPAAVSTTGGTWAEGGALATLGKLIGAMVASNRAYLTGAFTTAATLTIAQTVPTPNGAAPYTRFIGYGSVRGDAGQATLTLQTNTGLTALAVTGQGVSLEQLAIDCATLGTSTGISLSAAAGQPIVRACKVSNFTTAGISTSTSNYQLIEDCEITGGGAAATAAISMGAGIGSVIRCYVHDNACPGISLSTCQGAFLYNIVANNSGASSDGFQVSHGQQIENNTIHNNGRDGIHNTGSNNFGAQWKDNLITSNGASGAGSGINGSTGTALPAAPEFDGNAYWNNATAARTNADNATGIFSVNPYVNTHDVILTSSPYVGPTTGASANFALNNTAGAGAACRSVGLPGTFPGLSGTVGFEDIGAVQHKDVPATPGIIVPA